MNKTRVLFAGTPEIAVPLLKALIADSSFEVVGVLTATDKRGARKSVLVPSPVKNAALENGLPVIQYESLRTQAREDVKLLKPDVLVTFAYGKIFGPMFLNLFEKGAFNVHPSALPHLRGASPVQHTILEASRECTLSFQRLALEMDAGDIVAVHSFKLCGTETTETLSEKVALFAAENVPGDLAKVLSGSVNPVAQSGKPTFCSVLEKKDAVLDFNSNVLDLHCRIRAMYPWPKAVCKANGKDIFITGVWGGFDDIDTSNEDFAYYKPGQAVGLVKKKGLGIKCSDGVLWVTSLQLPGKKETDVFSFANGNKWIVEATFS